MTDPTPGSAAWSEGGRIVPAYLGWGNPDRDKVGMRLYATDRDDSPRWADEPGGRVAEYALRERGWAEGDRFLVVYVGDRFVKAERLHTIAAVVEELLND